MSRTNPYEPPYEQVIGAGAVEAPLTTRIERRITNPWPDQTAPTPIYFSHNDKVARPDYDIPPSLVNPDGFTAFDSILRDATGYTGPDYVGSFIRGYSGFTFPATFQETSVSFAPGLGVGAMLNVKTPTWQEWRDVAAGMWDDHITAFFESWPVGTPGTVTLNHEPENDVGNDLPSENPYRPYRNDNPVYLEWAQEWGPIWCRSIARFIKVAGEVIRARGLDVKVGGCLMEYSFNSFTRGRWNFWNWWDYVDPNDMDVAEFQIDIYGRALSTSPISYQDLIPRFMESLRPARAAGIHYWSIYETAISLMEHNGGDTVLDDPDDAQRAAWWADFADRLSQIPGGRFVSYFAVPNEPPEAWIRGDTLEAFGDICLSGKRVESPPNGSFEQGNVGWSTNQYQSSVASLSARTGNRVMRLDVDAAGRYPVCDRKPVNPGDKFRVGCWFRRYSGSSAIAVAPIMSTWNASNNRTNTLVPSGDRGSVSSSAWQYVEYDFTAPAGAVQVAFGPWAAVTPGCVADADDITVEPLV